LSIRYRKQRANLECRDSKGILERWGATRYMRRSKGRWARDVIGNAATTGVVVGSSADVESGFEIHRTAGEGFDDVEPTAPGGPAGAVAGSILGCAWDLGVEEPLGKMKC
jgi:hypothetical protein